MRDAPDPALPCFTQPAEQYTHSLSGSLLSCQTSSTSKYGTVSLFMAEGMHLLPLRWCRVDDKYVLLACQHICALAEVLWPV